MMRALVLVAMVCWSGALAALDLQPAEAVERIGGGVTVAVPPDWRDAPPSGAALALESAHGDDDAARRAAGRIAVVVTASDARDTAAAAERALDDLSRVATGLQVLDQRDEVVAGRSWHRVRLHFRTGQLGWEQTLAIAVDRGRIATICLSSDIAHAQQWSATFDAAIASLRWDPAAPLDAAP